MDSDHCRPTLMAVLSLGMLIYNRAEAMILRSCLGVPFSQQGEIQGDLWPFFSTMIPVVSQMMTTPASSTTSQCFPFCANCRRFDNYPACIPATPLPSFSKPNRRAYRCPCQIHGSSRNLFTALPMSVLGPISRRHIYCTHVTLQCAVRRLPKLGWILCLT